MKPITDHRGKLSRRLVGKGLLVHEDKRPVADHSVASACGVTGIAEINATRAQAALAGEMQKPADRSEATRMVGV